MEVIIKDIKAGEQITISCEMDTQEIKKSKKRNKKLLKREHEIKPGVIEVEQKY